MAYLFQQIHHIGYVRDTNDKECLVVDKEAAIVIQRIYREYLAGINCHCIARNLNNDLIPTRIEHMKKVGVNIGKSKKPQMIQYKVEKGDTVKSISERFKVYPEEIMKLNNITSYLQEKELVGQVIYIPKKVIWSDAMVRDILRNEMYTGYSVFGKTENKSYKDNTKIALSRKDWIRIPNCHEPIIDREEWLQVQEKLKNNTYNDRTIPQNLFAKKLYCSCCGRGMQKRKTRKKNDNDYYLSCMTVNKIGRFCDNRKVIRKSELEKIILKKINEQLNKYYNSQNVENKYNKLLHIDIDKKIEKLKLQFNNVEYVLSEKTNKLNLLYEDRMNGIISVEEFKILKSNIDNEMIKLNYQRNDINVQISNLENRKNVDKCEKNDLFEKYKQIDKLTPEILNEFVEKIYIERYDEITNSRNIKIIWNTSRKKEMA